MKEVVISAPHKYEIRDVPKPQIRHEKDVIVQMKAAGVCGSDHHIYHGKNPCTVYPRIPGHENVGIVVETGAAVTKVKKGDHVAIDLVIACGTCYQCKIGRRNVCESVTVRGSSADGGFREYVSAPEDEVFLIPHDIDFKDAALIEPFAIGAHCTSRGRLKADDIVFILGTGTIGSIILQTCKLKGCQVICCDIDDKSLERAKSYGADLTVNSKNDNWLSDVNAFTKGKGVSIAFDSACFQGSLTMLFTPGLVRNAGRIVSLGFTTEPESISQALLDQRELDLIGSRMSCYQFEPVIENIAKGRYNLEGIATHFINFNEIEKMFHYMDNPDPSVKKMVILF